MLIRSGTRGWKLGHHSGLPGSPDFIFPADRLVIFVDGCFWHGCRRCRTVPLTNRPFWDAKIKKNRERDRTAARALRSQGWTVVRIWEHDLRQHSVTVLRRFVTRHLG